MKANKLIPCMWILISMLFTIHNFAQKNIVGYEYAFNDGEGLQYTAITPTPDFNLVTNIDISALTSDINVLNIRFKDSDDLWSPIISSIFITPPVPDNVDTQIVGYEYAFNDGEGLQYVAVTPSQDFNLITDIDVSALPHDINVFHIRFLDDDGKWSSMISHIFIRPPESSTVDTNIVGYEYGFNDGADIQYVPVTPAQDFNLVTDIDVNALPHDINVFHVRFKADDGKWSSMISHIFIRPPEITTADANIIGYEYAFNDASSVQFTSIASTKDYNLVANIDANGLTSDLNMLYIRFLDDTGKWSSMLNHLFIRPPEPLVYMDNTIVAYDYWFDHDESTKVTVDVETPTADLLVAEVDMSQLWAGEHQLHTQFKDAYENYSLVMTDTIDKQVLPIASFISDLNSICVGETINFTNYSIDYDTVAWDFDDGDTSADFNTSHTFNTAGTFDVTLTVSESVSGLDSIATQSIQVYNYPISSVTVESYPTLMTADQIGATYQWIDCTNGNIDIDGETNQAFTPTIDGEYAVRITLNNCAVTSDCTTMTNLAVGDFELDKFVQLYPNPVEDILTVKSEIPLLIEIFSLSGVKIKTIDLNLGVNSIDLSRFKSGLYILKVMESSTNSNYKHSIYKIIKD